METKTRNIALRDLEGTELLLDLQNDFDPMIDFYLLKPSPFFLVLFP